MPNLTPEQALRLLSGLDLIRMSSEARRSVEAFLNAQAQAGTVNELEMQLRELDLERQVNIAEISRSVSQFNRSIVNGAASLLADIPDELFESAASEAGLDD